MVVSRCNLDHWIVHHRWQNQGELENRGKEAPAAGGGNKMLPPSQMIQQHSVIQGAPSTLTSSWVQMCKFDRVVY